MLVGGIKLHNPDLKCFINVHISTIRLNLLTFFLNSSTLAKYSSELLSFYGGMRFTLNLAKNFNRGFKKEFESSLIAKTS